MKFQQHKGWKLGKFILTIFFWGGGGGGDLKQKGMKMDGKGSFVWKLGISNFRIKA